MPTPTPDTPRGATPKDPNAGLLAFLRDLAAEQGRYYRSQAAFRDLGGYPNPPEPPKPPQNAPQRKETAS